MRSTCANCGNTLMRHYTKTMAPTDEWCALSACEYCNGTALAPYRGDGAYVCLTCGDVTHSRRKWRVVEKTEDRELPRGYDGIFCTRTCGYRFGLAVAKSMGGGT